MKLALLVLLGALLRVLDLGTRSYWYDESATVMVLDGDLGHVLATTAETEGSPPLYYVLAWLWTRVSGLHEAGLRSLTAVLGVALVPVAYAVGRRVAGTRGGLALALIAAVAPVAVFYAQEARTYALYLLVSGLSVLLAQRAVERPSARRLAGWAAVCALAVTAHYYAAFLVAAEAAWLAVATGRARAVLAAAALPAATGLALVPLALEQSEQAGELLTALPLHRRVTDGFVDFAVGPMAPSPALKVAAALTFAVALWLAARHTEPAVRRRAAAMLGLAAGVAGIAGLVALAGYDRINARNVLAAWVPAMAVCAAGFAAARAGWPRRAGLAALAAWSALAVGITFATADEPKLGQDDWRTAFQAVGALRDDRAVVMTPSRGDTPFAVYRGGAPFTGGTVREVVVIGLPRIVNPSGVDPAPPRPVAPSPPPPGFRVVERLDAPTFTLVRYRASRARRLSGRRLAGLRLDDDPLGGVAVRTERAGADPPAG